MVTWFTHAALLALVTTAGPESPEKIAVRKVDRVRISAEQQALARHVPEIYELLDFRGNTVSPREGNSLFVAPSGAFIIIPANVKEDQLMFEDTAVLQAPIPGDKNSPWLTASCHCSRQKDDECKIKKEKNGDAAAPDGQLVCEGPECCEIWIYGVLGDLTTIHQRA